MMPGNATIIGTYIGIYKQINKYLYLHVFTLIMIY